MGTHWDSRNKWLEGILSIGFGNEAGKDDPRGDTWNLILEKGTKGHDNHFETIIKCNPGTAYIIFGNAQGRTEKCNEDKVIHEACQCCWRHGINSDLSDKSVRLSMTLRTYDINWGTVEVTRKTSSSSQRSYRIIDVRGKKRKRGVSVLNFISNIFGAKEYVGIEYHYQGDIITGKMNTNGLMVVGDNGALMKSADWEVNVAKSKAKYFNKYAYIVSVDGKALSEKYNVLGLKKGSFRVNKCDFGKDLDTNNTKEDGIDNNGASSSSGSSSSSSGSSSSSTNSKVKDSKTMDQNNVMDNIDNSGSGNSNHAVTRTNNTTTTTTTTTTNTTSTISMSKVKTIEKNHCPSLGNNNNDDSVHWTNTQTSKHTISRKKEGLKKNALPRLEMLKKEQQKFVKRTDKIKKKKEEQQQQIARAELTANHMATVKKLTRQKRKKSSEDGERKKTKLEDNGTRNSDHLKKFMKIVESMEIEKKQESGVELDTTKGPLKGFKCVIAIRSKLGSTRPICDTYWTTSSGVKCRSSFEIQKRLNMLSFEDSRNYATAMFKQMNCIYLKSTRIRYLKKYWRWNTDGDCLIDENDDSVAYSRNNNNITSGSSSSSSSSNNNRGKVDSKMKEVVRHAENIIGGPSHEEYNPLYLVKWNGLRNPSWETYSNLVEMMGGCKYVDQLIHEYKNAAASNGGRNEKKKKNEEKKRESTNNKKRDVNNLRL